MKVDPRTKDLTGMRFGRLSVVSMFATRPVRWNCVCECGIERVIHASNLLNGRSTSCPTCAHKIHGHSSYSKASPEYRCYYNMLTRCYDSTNHHFDNYGGRGIVVCEHWRESFLYFLADMGPRPTPKHSLDRIDNNGNYSPANCRWATTEQQQSNRTDNHYLTHDGVKLTVSAWARKIGIRPISLLMRIRRGETTERALSNANRRHVTYTH